MGISYARAHKLTKKEEFKIKNYGRKVRTHKKYILPIKNMGVSYVRAHKLMKNGEILY